MLSFAFSVDLKKSKVAKEYLADRQVKQGEVAMALLAMERFKMEIMQFEFGDEEVEVHGRHE